MVWKRFSAFFAVLSLLMMLFVPGEARCQQSADEGLSLEDCVRMALDRSLAVRSADEAVRQAVAEEKKAFAEFFPKLSAEYSYLKLNEAPAAEIPAGAFGPGFPPQDVTMPMGWEETYEFKLSATQPIFAGGAIRYGHEIAKLGIDRAEIDRINERQKLILKVHEAYYSVLKARDLKEVAEQAVKTIEAHTEVAQAFYNVGMIPKNDLLKAEVELANARQNLTRAKHGVDLAESVLNMLLRRPLDEPVKLRGELKYTPLTYNLEEAIRVGLQERPEIKSLKIAVEQAERAVKIARGSYFPRLVLVGNYSWRGDEWDVSAEDSWSIYAAAQWTFFETGKSVAEVNMAKSRLSQAEFALKQVEDGIKLEIKEAYLQLKEAEKNIFVAEKSIEQAEENLRMNRERYKEQVATSTDVLDAQTLLTEAQTRYYNALSDYNIAHARLERAMGRIR